MPACLCLFLMEEKELEGKYNMASVERILNVMLELLKMIFLSVWKVCYKRSWQVQSSPRYPHHPRMT